MSCFIQIADIRIDFFRLFEYPKIRNVPTVVCAHLLKFTSRSPVAVSHHRDGFPYRPMNVFRHTNAGDPTRKIRTAVEGIYTRHPSHVAAVFRLCLRIYDRTNDNETISPSSVKVVLCRNARCPRKLRPLCRSFAFIKIYPSTLFTV